MRPEFLIVTLIIASAFFAIIFWVRPIKKTVAAFPKQKPIQSANNVPAILPNTSQNVQNVINQSPILTSSTNSKPTPDEVQRFIQTANENYHKPIESFWQVIDQNSNPVSNVKIKASITQEQMSMPTASGSYPIANTIVRLEKETMADGRFEITGEWGSALDIDAIEKDGYEVEPTPPSHDNIEGSYISPVIFKMWSTNIHEKLITGEKSFEIVPNGQPYFIDLTKGKITRTEGGDLKVWVKYPEQTVHTQYYDWSCEIDVINGGLQLGDSYSMFSAPADGYVPSFSLQKKIRGGGRGSIGDKRFYVMLKNGKIFGRIQIDLVAPFNTSIPGLIRLSYAINPSGSRILR